MVSFSVRKEPIAEGAEEVRRDAEREADVEEDRERVPLEAEVGVEEVGRVAPTAAEDRGTSPLGEVWERVGLVVRMGFLAMESV